MNFATSLTWGNEIQKEKRPSMPGWSGPASTIRCRLASLNRPVCEDETVRPFVGTGLQRMIEVSTSTPRCVRRSVSNRW